MAYDLGTHVAPEGPQVIPIPLTLSAGVPFVLDLNYIRQFLAPNISITQILSIAINVSTAMPGAIALTMPTGQRIGSFPWTGGLENFVPVLIPNQDLRLTIELIGGAGGNLVVIICNELICGLKEWT